MKIAYLTILAGCTIFLWSCSNKTTMDQKAIDVANMDLSVNPGDDFNQYANGGWIKNNPLPEDRSRFGSFDKLADENEKQLKELVEELAATSHQSGSVADKISKFYKSGIDSAVIEQKGITVLNDEFDRINNIQNADDLQRVIEYYHSHWITVGFIMFGSADAKNSDMVITHLYQGGIGLPDRDYYLNNDERFVKIREKYIEHIATMLQYMGDTPEKSLATANQIFNFEKQLATASMDRLLLRDPHKTYNKKTLTELSTLADNFDWVAYFNNLGLGQIKEVVVAQPDFIVAFNNLLEQESIETWKSYFRWHLIHSMAPYLNNDVVVENFNFYGKFLSGTPEMKPRWKRVLNATNEMLDEAVGQIYVEKYFPPEAKDRMLLLVENLRWGLGERIKNLDWMSDTTKIKAQEKLAAIRVKIGYPDKWKDYSTFNIEENAYAINIMRGNNFSFTDMVSKIDKPVDKAEWHMPPQMVNAYYSPTQNEIVFPAAILQPPFFHLNADDAVNYGAIGVVIGHEMTHGFDDQGRLFDKNGNLNTWWVDADAERFNERTKVLVDQFNEFTVLDSVKANGEYTLGENIADLGGLNISYTAFMLTEQSKNKEAKIDGFTADQRFFLAYAHVWAQNIRNEEILRLTQEDVHSLGKLRVVGPLRNLPEFHSAFNITEGQYMYLPENQRAVIW